VKVGYAWWSVALMAAVACVVALYWLVVGRLPAIAANASGADLPIRVLESRSKRGHFVVEAEASLNPVSTGVTHEWVVTVLDAKRTRVSGCSVRFDGEMPAHGHGLPTAPRVTQELEPGRYLVEGVRFSMPGQWRLLVALERCAGHQDTAAFDLQL
jgi:hypothetical protein